MSALTRLVARTVVIVGLANLVAELLIYGAVIAPSTADDAAVSPWMWVFMYVPVFMACVWVSAGVHRVAEVVVVGVASGVVAQVEKWALALLDAPGHEASLALVSPITFWTSHFARMTSGFIVLFAVLFVSRRMLASARGAG
jgi:hypothetical protein